MNIARASWVCAALLAACAAVGVWAWVRLPPGALIAVQSRYEADVVFGPVRARAGGAPSALRGYLETEQARTRQLDKALADKTATADTLRSRLEDALRDSFETRLQRR